jgi:hypothetical protein
MASNIMANGKIIVEMVGVFMKINKLLINMLEIGNKIKRMVLENKSLLYIFIKVIL